jgi:ribosome-associated translation inhibitor RaiA
MSTTPSPSDATVEKCLHLGHGFHEDERSKVVGILDKLDHRLTGVAADRVRLDLHVKERERPGQRVTLEGHVGGLPAIVATSDKADIWVAVADARDEFLRQLNDAKTRREPHHHPHH